MKICKNCNINKEYSLFYKHNKYKDGYRPICIECFKIKKAEYQKSNTNKSKYCQKWVKNNRPHSRAYQNEYKRIKRQTDPVYNLKLRMRTRLKEILQIKNIKKCNTTFFYVGCDINELKQHIESLFQPGMTWDNRNLWEIDHIIPLALAKTEQELYKLCHFSNLQPLWIEDHKLKTKKDIEYIRANKKNVA